MSPANRPLVSVLFCMVLAGKHVGASIRVGVSDVAVRDCADGVDYEWRLWFLDGGPRSRISDIYRDEIAAACREWRKP